MSTTCTSMDFTKWLEMEKIPASGKLALFEAAQTYLVVDHNTAHRAYIFATTTPTRFVCARCYRRAVRRFSASPGMPPLSPTKKKKKRKVSGLAKYGSSGPVIAPAACHRRERLVFEVRCVGVVVIVVSAVCGGGGLPLRKMVRLGFCGSRTGESAGILNAWEAVSIEWCTTRTAVQ